jgi:hypothetical protein
MTVSVPPAPPEVLVRITVFDPKTEGSGAEPFTLRWGSVTALVSVTLPEASEFTVRPVDTPTTVSVKVELTAHPVRTTTLVWPTGMVTVAAHGPLELPLGLVTPPGGAGLVTLVVPG